MKHIRWDFSVAPFGLIPQVNIGGRAEAKIQLFRNMVMLHIKFKGTTYTVTWKQICAALFKSFIKIHLILLLKLPPGRFKFLEVFWII